MKNNGTQGNAFQLVSNRVRRCQQQAAEQEVMQAIKDEEVPILQGD